MDYEQKRKELLDKRCIQYSVYLSKEEVEHLQFSAALQRRTTGEQAAFYISKGAKWDIEKLRYEEEIKQRMNEIMGKESQSMNSPIDIPMPLPSAGTPPVPPPIPETLTEAQNQGKHNRIFTEKSTAPVPAPTPESQNDDKPVRLVLYLPTEDWEAVNYWAKSAGISPTIMTEKIIHNWSHSSILLPLDSDSA